MNQVSTFVMPFNNRFDLDPEGSEAILGEFTRLPLPMPRHVTAWTSADGKPVTMWVDDKRIRPADFAATWAAIEQYNADCQNRGVIYEDALTVDDAAAESDPSDEMEGSDDPTIDYTGGFGRP